MQVEIAGKCRKSVGFMRHELSVSATAAVAAKSAASAERIACRKKRSWQDHCQDRVRARRRERRRKVNEQASAKALLAKLRRAPLASGR